MKQQEEQQEAVNNTRVDMCESLMEEVAVEEQEAMEECKAAEKQRVRWADMEEGQTEERGRSWTVGRKDRRGFRNGNREMDESGCGGRRRQTRD